MKKFDESYVLLEAMVNDGYYPKFLVDKIKELIIPVIRLLENGETNKDIIQNKLDEMTLAINELQEEFDENDSEIETVARDSIAVLLLLSINTLPVIGEGNISVRSFPAGHSCPLNCIQCFFVRWIFLRTTNNPILCTSCF